MIDPGTGAWNPITFPAVRAGLVQIWLSTIDANADTSPESPDGLEITNLAMQIALAFETNSGLWAGSFFRSAYEQQLDNILDIFLKLRAGASFSTGTAIFYGAAGTLVQSGTQVLTADTAANRFGTTAAATTGALASSDAWMVRVKLNGGTLEVDESYQLTVDAFPTVSYGAVGGDTVITVATGLRDLLNGQGSATAALAGIDSLGSALLVVEVVGGPGDVVPNFTGPPYDVLDALEAVRAPVQATETGAVLAAGGTLQTLANPIAGIVGVSNDQDATPGAERQNDDQFRSSHLSTLFANSARTDGGMREAVSKVSGVEANSVVSNRTVFPEDADGRPKGSTENIILTDGTTDPQDLASAIARQIPAGIEPYGSTVLGLGETIDGEIIEVSGTFVEELYLHLDVTITAAEGFPVGDITQAVSTAISNYYTAGVISTAAGVTTDENAILVIDKNMTRTSALTPINSLTNNATSSVVILTDTTAAPNDVPVFADVDRPASSRQIIKVAALRITVTVI